MPLKWRGSTGAPGESAPSIPASELQHLSQLPDELAFLRDPQCNPDLSDLRNQRTGRIRSNAADRTSSHNTHHYRQALGHIVSSWVFQTVVILVILMDLVLTCLSFTDVLDEDSGVSEALSWVILCVLAVDVIGRLMYQGYSFWKKCMNVFEFMLVPITLVEMLLLRHLNLPLPLLRTLRPIFRGIRVARVLIRSLGRGSEYLSHVRALVSGDRIRYRQDGFDLDLCYITGQIIAMSLPAVGHDAMFRNPHLEVAQFLNEKHGNKYLVVNTTTRQSYPTASFFGRVFHFPILTNSVPSLDALLRLCTILDMYMEADPKHVVCVHSLNAQGRTCVVVGALLTFRKQVRGAQEVTSFLDRARLDPAERHSGSVQTFDSASQRRFLHYFSHICRVAERKTLARPARLVKVQVFGLTDTASIDVSCVSTPGLSVDASTGRLTARAAMRSLRAVPGQAAPPGAEQQNDVVEGAVVPEQVVMDVKPEADVIEAELEVEELDEDIALMPTDAVKSGLHKIMEERTYDSVSAGCTASTGKLMFSSVAHSAGLGGSLIRHQDGHRPSAPGLWLCSGSELTGDFRLEVSRRLPQREEKGKKQKSHMLWFREAQRKVADFELRKKFEGGLLFAISLHPAYLEFDEPTEMASHLRHCNTTVVVLDRFSVDKAAEAPPLRTYPETFRVQLEFEVGHRLDHKAEMELVAPLVQSLAMHHSPNYDMGWLSWVSEKVWPSFRRGLEKMFSVDILPSIRQSLPGPLKNIKLTECSLGDAHPQFGPISACSRSHDGLEVQIDMHIEYITQTSIVLDAGIASFSINSLKIKGVVSIRFKPILPELPVLASMQLLFLNPPDIDLKFGNLLEVANWPMAKHILFGAANSAIYDLMVLPNLICLNWGDSTNDRTLSFTNLLPCAVMRVNIVEGHGLQNEATMFKRELNCSVSMKIGPQEATTDNISAATPVWNEFFDFLVYDERQCAQLTVMDSDFAGRQHFIGRSEDVPIQKCIEAGADGLWVPVYQGSQSGKARDSKVLVSSTMYNLAADPEMICGILDRALLGNASHSTGLQGGDSSSFRGASTEQTEQGEAPVAHRRTTAAVRSGAIILLVCDVIGCYVPDEVATADALIEIKVVVGDHEASQRVAKASKPSYGPLSDKVVESINNLSRHGMLAHQISEMLGEELANVQRVIKHAAWNYEVGQKMSVLVHPADLKNGHPTLDIFFLVKGRVRAQGTVDATDIFRSSTARLCSVVDCQTTVGEHPIRCEIDFRPFALVRPPRNQQLAMGVTTTSGNTDLAYV